LGRGHADSIFGGSVIEPTLFSLRRVQVQGLTQTCTWKIVIGN
jgi:hypothetical protein